MTSEDWTWEFRPTAVEAFETLETDDQQRIVDKLDAIVDDEWRDPDEYVEPLTGLPHGKIRVGEYRLGARAERETNRLVVYDIAHRSGAYDADDD